MLTASEVFEGNLLLCTTWLELEILFLGTSVLLIVGYATGLLATIMLDMWHDLHLATNANSTCCTRFYRILDNSAKTKSCMQYLNAAKIGTVTIHKQEININYMM